jgi:1-acyl-sn-glycerol-3-phosphate acyltransferase
VLPRAELDQMLDATDRVARGDCSMLIFPEGHRTRSGSLGPFMRAGLRLTLQRCRRPVYAIVSDGMANVSRMKDLLTRFEAPRIVVRVIGPMQPPDDEHLDEFIEELHGRMAAELEDIRRS